MASSPRKTARKSAKRSDDDDVKQAFYKSVNLSGRELTAWLKTVESKSVGFDSGDGESVGHKSGWRIVTILKKKRAELTADDVKHMRKVVGFIRRPCAQGPKEKIETSRRRYSLNWGHDPSKLSKGDMPWLD